MKRILIATVLFCAILLNFSRVQIVSGQAEEPAAGQTWTESYGYDYEGIYQGLNLAEVWQSITADLLVPSTAEKEKTEPEKIVIAVLDTGVDTENKYLKESIITGVDFLKEPGGGGEVQDYRGHGTMVAGTILKICPWAGIMPVRVAEPMFGWSNHKVLVQGIIWAADHQAKIICIPIGGWMGSQTLKEAVKYAYDKGCVIIASSGATLGANQDFYPAGYYDYVISVTAVDENGKLLENANLTPQTYLAAPTPVYATTLQNEFGWLEGSSGSTAVVAGVAGLLLTKNTKLPPARIRQILRQSGNQIPIPNFYPFFKAKIVNPPAALKLTDFQLGDRAIGSFEIFPEQPLPGQTLHLNIAVKNQGNTRLAPSRLQVNLNKQVVQKDGQDWLAVPALEPGQDFEITMSTPAPSTTGNANISAALELQPGETNIENNAVIRNITVTEEKTRGVEITNVRTAEADAGKNSLDFILTLRNSGNTDEDKVIIESDVEGPLPVQTLALKAGETKEVTVAWTRQDPAGQVFIMQADCFLDEPTGENPQDEIALNFHFDPNLGLVR